MAGKTRVTLRIAETQFKDMLNLVTGSKIENKLAIKMNFYPANKKRQIKVNKKN